MGVGRLRRSALLRLAPLVTGLILLPACGARAQGEANPEWRVYMKESPCAETLRDWMTVADRNPTEGLNIYSPARSASMPNPSHTFERTPAGFAAAQTRADLLRIMGILPNAETGQVADYDDFCCSVYWVWQDQDVFAVVRGSDDPGPGWDNVAGPLCLEHAAALAGSPGGLGDFRLSTGDLIRFTGTDFVVLGALAVSVEGIVIPPLTASGSAGGRAGTYAFEGTLGEQVTRIYASNLALVPTPIPGNGHIRLVMDEVGRVTEVAIQFEVLGEVVEQDPYLHCGIGRWTWMTVAQPPIQRGESYGHWVDPSTGSVYVEATPEMFESDIALEVDALGEDLKYNVGSECEEPVTDPGNPYSSTFRFTFMDDTTLAMCPIDVRTRAECLAEPFALLAKVDGH